MRIKQLWSCLAVAAVAFLALESQAQSLISRSQLRRTVDPSQRSATGKVVLEVDSKGVQSMEVDVTGLEPDSFAEFVAPFSSFGTDCCTYAVAPLGRVNSKKGTWSRRLTGSGAAPTELVNLGFNNLIDLDGLRTDIAKPGVNNEIIAFTNVINAVTNVIFGIPVPTPGVTNIVYTILWAPLYAPTVNPSARSYVRKGTMVRTIVPPSPHAKGTMTLRFKGTSGESVFDIKATRLEAGQAYHVWVANSTNQNSFLLIDAGTMTTSKFGSSARFLRDTRFGDPLPQQARDAGDLSGHVVEIRDEFDFVHLQGVLP
ncbi:MAG: hypothetical protein ABSH14_06820 [Verrucomicrobiia bacterium]|jgi:hypothetical protein